MIEKRVRMEELVARLNEAAKAYYQENREILSNYEYDRLYDELVCLEKETGIVWSNSPTRRVGYELLGELPKERHASPMLSLDKTKEIPVLQEFLGEQKGILSWKLDGLTIVLTYEEGALAKAVTRGNGEIGEVITNNARVFANVPVRIPFAGRLVLRGEAIITYSEFERINETIEDTDARYKNPRNLCSGSVRQLNNQITAGRNVRFAAFSLVSAAGVDFENSREKQFVWLRDQGFEVVEYETVTKETLPAAVERYAEKIGENDYPSDGLVLLMDDIAYGQSLGQTAKFPRDSLAFKWKDEVAVSRLKYIEWSPSRTGLINPIAVFEPVELEGTTVSRASVHNLSMMENLKLGEGDEITVYKANMIIPQIAENLTASGPVKAPDTCPVCGGKTEVRQAADVKVLYCTNPECQAKKIKGFALFAGRDAMNIEGLSEATLEKFIGAGLIKDLADLFHLKEHKEAIVEMEGFGEKSYEKLAAAVEKARHTTLPRLIYGLGIANIGVANAKVLSRHFAGDLDAILAASKEELAAVDGIGPVIAESVTKFFEKEENRDRITRLQKEVVLPDTEAEAEAAGGALLGKQFVITGKVVSFANRNALKEAIEQAGGKVTGSVSAKTDYLINNDAASSSSKNQAAKELGIPILSEAEFLKMLSEEGL